MTDSASTELGPNAGLVDEMYRLYQENPQAVSEGWRDFFADYRPRGETTPSSTVLRPGTGPDPHRPAAVHGSEGQQRSRTRRARRGDAPAAARCGGPHRQQHGGEPRSADRDVGARGARQAARGQPPDPQQPPRARPRRQGVVHAPDRLRGAARPAFGPGDELELRPRRRQAQCRAPRAREPRPRDRHAAPRRDAHVARPQREAGRHARLRRLPRRVRRSHPARPRQRA